MLNETLAPAALPRGLRVYAVGDVHGCDARLAALHAAIARDAAARPSVARTVLVHLGDYVDRGPDSKGVLERVVELRNRCAANHGPVADQARDENQLVDALKRLFVLVENYPQLKADQHFLKLQQELINTENRIQAARRFYNGNVRDYRNKRETFPSNLVANLFHFQAEEFFSVPPSVQEVPNVEFGQP